MDGELGELALDFRLIFQDARTVARHPARLRNGDEVQELDEMLLGGVKSGIAWCVAWFLAHFLCVLCMRLQPKMPSHNRHNAGFPCFLIMNWWAVDQWCIGSRSLGEPLMVLLAIVMKYR